MIDPMAPTIDELDAMQSAPDEQSKALALAQQAGKCAAWVLNVEKQEVKWLPGGYEIFGMPFADFVGRIQPIELVLPADKPKVYSALAATLDKRFYDIVIFKVLGARKADIIKAFLTEWMIIAAVTAVIATLLGSLGAWLILKKLDWLEFHWMFGIIAKVIVLTIAFVAFTGFIIHARVFTAKASIVLRNE